MMSKLKIKQEYSSKLQINILGWINIKTLMNNIESNNLKFPITFNILIEETINTVYYLEHQSQFKQDISSLNKSSFEENGIIVIYADYIRIENSLFTQNIGYNMIKDLISEESNVWKILLKNNEEIKLTFEDNAQNLDLTYSSIDYKIKGNNTVIYSVPCELKLNKNLIFNSGNLCRIKRNLDLQNYTYSELGDLKVFETHLKIITNSLEFIIPYNRLKESKPNNYSLELILLDNSNIFLENIPAVKFNEILSFINVKIMNPPEYHNDNSPVAPVNQLSNSFTQSPQVMQQQPANNFSNNNEYNAPRNHKSKIVGLILNMLVVGLGYAYVGKWGDGLILFVIYTALIAFGILFLIIGIGLLFILGAIILWIYSLFKTNDMIDKYNAGLPY